MAMTAKDLIALKTDFISKKDETIDIEIKDIGTWTFNVPTSSDILDAHVYCNDHYGGGKQNLDRVFVFRQVKEPDLYDAELVAALGEVAGNTDAKAGDWEMDIILKPGQIDRISDLLMYQAGYTTDCAKAIIETEIKGAEEVKK